MLGVVGRGTVPVFVSGRTLDEVLDYSACRADHEVGGFLLGGVYEHRELYVEIDQFVPAARAASGFASLKFTHETWARLNRQIEREFCDKFVVGWHHTHPGFGVFLSQHDLFIHRNFFCQRWQTALVVDPRQQKFGFFCWSGQEIVNCGFVLMADD